MTRIVVVDYGMGNRRSVQKALEHVGAVASITSGHDEIRAADGLVVPGVGAFPKAMRNLNDLDLPSLIHQRVAQGTPLLGICLGMQLLFDSSPGARADDRSRVDSGGRHAAEDRGAPRSPHRLE